MINQINEGGSTSLDDLLARVRAVEDFQAIANLKAEYINAIDGGWHKPSHDPVGVELFTEDAIWEVEGIGSAKGHEAIRGLFEQWQQQVPFGYHAICNPHITVNGDQATGQWHLIAFVTNRGGVKQDGDEPGELFAATVYYDEFTRVDGTWKISSLREKIAFFEPFKDGWANAPGLTR